MFPTHQYKEGDSQAFMAKALEEAKTPDKKLLGFPC